LKPPATTASFLAHSHPRTGWWLFHRSAACVRDLALVDNDPLTSLAFAQAMTGLNFRTCPVRCLDFH
jgi:hypothetical protein